MCKFWMSQFYFSLGFLSQYSLWKLLIFHGIRAIYTCVCLECEESGFPKQSWLAAWPRELTEPRVQAAN